MAEPKEERKSKKVWKLLKGPETNEEFLEAIARIPEKGIGRKKVKDKLIDYIKDANRSSMEDLKRLESDCSKYCDSHKLIGYAVALGIAISLSTLFTDRGEEVIASSLLVLALAIVLLVHLANRFIGALKRTLYVLHCVRNEILKREGWQIVADDEQPDSGPSSLSKNIEEVQSKRIQKELDDTIEQSSTRKAKKRNDANESI